MSCFYSVGSYTEWNCVQAEFAMEGMSDDEEFVVKKKVKKQSQVKKP